jgi:hypothetical protein
MTPAYALGSCVHDVRAVSTGRDRDDERRGFSGFSLRPTNWQASVRPVRLIYSPTIVLTIATGKAVHWLPCRQSSDSACRNFDRVQLKQDKRTGSRLVQQVVRLRRVVPPRTLRDQRALAASTHSPSSERCRSGGTLRRYLRSFSHLLTFRLVSCRTIFGSFCAIFTPTV